MTVDPRHVGALVEKTLSDALADPHMCRTGFVPRDIAKLAVIVALDASADVLRTAAEGRREYARGMEGAENLREGHASLLLQASTLDHAASVVEGDLGPLYGWLPSWRWTDLMQARLAAREETP